MTDDSEETEPLNMTVSNIPNNHRLESFFKFNNTIQVIQRMSPFGNSELLVVTRERLNETVQIFLTASSFQSFDNSSHQLTPYDVRRMNTLNRLFSEYLNLFHTQTEILENDNDFIEWSVVGDNLIEKRRQFREQIDLYKTYTYQHHSITRLLIEIIDYYINEYLALEGSFTMKDIKKLEKYFQQAIKEKNYLKYFIKVYTLSHSFNKALNRHLALYILDYFDIYSYSSLPKGYRLINCLIYIVTLLINHPDIQKYQHNGIVYRGLLMTQNALEHYSIGNHILNRSFVSTTKERMIAEIFAGSDRSEVSEQNLGNRGLKEVSVLLTYTIKQNQTAIDITHLSTIQDEEEILILPFSVFQVKNRIEGCENMGSPMLTEIELEECADDEEINDEKPLGKQF